MFLSQKKPQYLLPLLLLISAVLLRGLLLEYTDLVDPTEARYATVAQEMILLDDWLTPRLPMPEGVVPYMGKPPFHFWLTAGSYSLFGVDEWTARLPSWISSILILLVIWSFGRRFFNEQSAIAAALIAFSSGMLFFISGASVTDVTLTALVSAATYFLYQYIQTGQNRKRYAFYASALMALAFLTKGPVAIVLVWLPIILWSAVCKNFQWLKSIPWTNSSLIFLAITAPWFIANEISTPGSLKYFFWNENIARYLFKEYGDKYGSGHVHSYGTSWLMLFAAFAPWSLILIWKFIDLGFKEIYKKLRGDEHLLFAFIWGISAAIFFTFVRQLHAMYVLPCIPGIALFTASLLKTETDKSISFLKSKKFSYSIGIISLAIISTGAILSFSSISLFFGICLAAFGVFILNKLKESNSSYAHVQLLSSSSFLIYFLVIVCMTPYIDERRSAAELLYNLADSTIEEYKVPRVGIMTKNNFSFYWTSKAWHNELSRKVRIQYVEPTNIPKNVKHMILREKDVNKLSNRFKSAFVFEKQVGKWQLFNRIDKV